MEQLLILIFSLSITILLYYIGKKLSIKVRKANVYNYCFYFRKFIIKSINISFSLGLDCAINKVIATKVLLFFCGHNHQAILKH